MAQSGYTPISLYFSATGAAVPSAGNLVAGELALNTNDGKLYFKNSSGVVTLLAGSTSGPAGGSTTQVQYNNSGVLAGITGATTNGTALTLVAPVLGTPASATLTNATGLPISTGVSGLGTNVATALGVNVGTAGAFVVNGGALGSPSTAGTMPAFTLGGTVSGGGNQINNVVIGTTTPLAGNFTTLSASGLISGSNGWFTGRNAPSSGTGVEVFSAGGNGQLLGYNRTGAAYVPLVYDASNHTFNISGSTVASVSSTGLAVTGTLSTTGNATLNGAIVLDGTSINSFFDNDSSAYIFRTGGGAGDFNSEAGHLVLQPRGSTGAARSVIIGAGATTTSEVARFSSTGLEVTGTLSATTEITAAFGTSVPLLMGRGTALTTGAGANDSAIRFDGVSGNLLFSANATERLRLSSTGTLSGGTSGTGYSFSGSAPATSLTLDSSGNLGIGVNSPTNPLHIVSNTVSQLNIAASSGNTNAQINLEPTGTGIALIGPANNVDFAFRTNATERARISAAGDFTVSTGNLIVGTAGKGIDFSATASGSGTMTSELLADYEEGTWTPSLGGNTTYSTQAGTYTKIGRQVTVIATVAVSVLGTGSTTTISGLPFSTNATSISGNAVAKFTNLAVNVIGLNVLALDGTVSTLRFANITAAGATNTLDPAIFGNNAGVSFSVTYFVN